MRQRRPGLTVNMLAIYLTFATFHCRGWSNLSVSCQMRRGAEARATGWREPRLTENIEDMYVTLATSHSSGWSKLSAPCQVRRGAEARAAGGMGQRPGLH